MSELFFFLNYIPFLDEGLEIILALHAVALVIVNMTDTPTDNKLLATVYRYVEIVAGIVRSSKVKQPGSADTNLADDLFQKPK